MKTLFKVCLLGSLLVAAASAQQETEPTLKKGVPVDMPVASHAVEMRAADSMDATVVAITADGKLFLGIDPTEPAALSTLNAQTVYVKADSRAPFQAVLTTLNALRGKSVVFLAASPGNDKRTARITWPYGIKVIVPGDHPD